MNVTTIQDRISDVYETCGVRNFPIDCFFILDTLGIQYRGYSRLSPDKRRTCYEISEDAFTIHRIIHYKDDSCWGGRIRFSLMHELGHLVLDSQSEADANQFASHLLAPRMVIHYSGCKNSGDVAAMFDLSFEAAEYAFQDYKTWHRTAKLRMSPSDRRMYRYFYNSEAGKFVFEQHPCCWCQKMMYNTKEHTCPVCLYKTYPERGNVFDDPLSPDSIAMGRPVF